MKLFISRFSVMCRLGMSEEEVIKAALKDYYDRHGIAYDPALFADMHDCESCDV